MKQPSVCVAVERNEFDLLFSPSTQERLRDLALVEFGTGDRGSALPPESADRYDAIITSWSTTPFGIKALQGERLRLVVHSAGSVRHLLPRELLAQGLRLSQGGAEAMAPAVAELALTLTLALLRNLHHHDRHLWSDRDWAKARDPILGQALSARRVGLVGLSRVGRHYARMLRAFGTSVIKAYDPYADQQSAAALGIELVELDELFASCDVIAVHAPSTPETHHLVGAAQLAALPAGAVVVNTARSWVVDQDALLAELVEGRLRAGLDVFDEEPLPADSPFLGLPNVIVTPHVAGATIEARRMQGQIVVDELGRFAADLPLKHEITLDRYDLLA